MYSQTINIFSLTVSLADFIVFCLFFPIALLAISLMIVLIYRLVSLNKANKKAGNKRRVPRHATIVNKDGDKIGKVRKSVCYDSDKNKLGELVREDDDIYMVNEGERKCYLDKNDNLFTTTDNTYYASLKHGRVWLILLIVFLIAAIVVVSSLFAALYTPKSDDYIPTLFIADEEGISWDQHEDLPIFFNSKFGDTIIEPGQTGKYTFIVENRNKDEIKYNLMFSCENEYGIRLVYRLKRDGAYISGYDGYVLPEDLSINDLTQQTSSKSVFELEWKWEHNDEVDTIAGENSAMYKLHIGFLAELNKK